MGSDRLALVVALAAVLLLGAAAIVAIATDGGDEADRQRALTAIGTAERRVDPQVARVRLGVTARRTGPQAATSAASTALRRVIAAARRIGVAELQTEPVRVDREPARPRPDDGSEPDAPPFVARQAITVRLRDLGRVGALIDAAVEAGATEVVGPRFELAEPARSRRRALADAVADARASARQMAEAAGVRLGRPLRVEERRDGGPARPEAQRQDAAAGTPPPTVPGPIIVQATVTVTFALR